MDDLVKIQHPSAELPGDFDNSPTCGSATETDQDDPWLLRDDATATLPEFKTWDGFELPQANVEPATFMTEARASTYDAFLASTENPCRIKSHDSYETLDSRTYSACLLALSLGRESVLFSWSPETRTFMPALSLIKVSGYSGDSLSGIVRLCTSCGVACHQLRSFVDKTYSTSAAPSRVALANAVNRLLLVVQDELGVRGLRTRSILQLQSLVRPAFALLSYFQRLIAKVKGSMSDSALSSLIYQESAELSEPFLKNTMGEILRMVSKPWIGFVEAWIGLRMEDGVPITKDGPGKGFVRVDTNMWIDDQGFELTEPDYFLDMDNMPTFVPDDVAQAIFETGRNLRFLQSYHPQHPLSSFKAISTLHAPKLEWQYDWESIKRVEQKALAYHHAISETLRSNRAVGGTQKGRSDNIATVEDPHVLQFFGKDEPDLQESVLASIAHLNQPISRAEPWDKLSTGLRKGLFRTHDGVDMVDIDFSPHWSLLPLLSFGPLVYAQARLVNRECLRLLYKEHDLRQHLRLQRAFQLLGNGVFSSRLSNALFSPDLDTTERQSGTARSGGTMGLRLASRDSWPPASSELRLALIGVLSESYQQDLGDRDKKTAASISKTAELPGDLSFAIRDLSSAEMKKCMDPASLEALDFLRMSYKPPSPLSPIMTPAILLKYDRIFKLLLRVLRMLFVVDQLFRDISEVSRWQEPDNASLRFRIEAHHFVSNVARYFFDTGIDKHWRSFEKWLDHVEKGLEDTDAAVNSSSISPDRLGEQHERTLDEIMTSLLLRKRQQPVLKLLEEIFTLILRFAKKARLRAEGAQEQPSQDMEGLYKAFRAKVEVFITVCRGMTEKFGYGQKREGKADENSIVMLVLLLDMSNYYVKP